MLHQINFGVGSRQLRVKIFCDIFLFSIFVFPNEVDIGPIEEGQMRFTLQVGKFKSVLARRFWLQNKHSADGPVDKFSIRI